jgi:enoyl-CoA hydratase/carnithine racemase
VSESVNSPLLIERRDHILLVTLNRPRRRNALDDALMTELRTLWANAEVLDGIHCIVVTGAEPGFCSGADMSVLSRDRSDAPPSAREELGFLPGAQVRCPVVVAVNGVCAGGGLHFVADADIAIASGDAVFLDPHVSVGQVSGLEPLTLWPRVQAGVIARMTLLGSSERLTASDALRVGLVSEVVSAPELQRRALELAEVIAANSPEAVAATRQVFRSFIDGLLGQSLDDGWATIRAHWSHPDSKEGPLAFTEKRPPRWVDG